MYKKDCFKYYTPCGSITGKQQVVADFMEDIKNCKPVNITERKTSITVCFDSIKYTCLYTLPIAYKKYITEE